MVKNKRHGIPLPLSTRDPHSEEWQMNVGRKMQILLDFFLTAFFLPFFSYNNYQRLKIKIWKLDLPGNANSSAPNIRQCNVTLFYIGSNEGYIEGIGRKLNHHNASNIIFYSIILKVVTCFVWNSTKKKRLFDLRKFLFI